MEAGNTTFCQQEKQGLGAVWRHIKNDVAAFNKDSSSATQMVLSALLTLEIQAVIAYRINSYLYRRGSVFRALSRITYYFSCVLTSCQVSPLAQIGSRFVIGHATGIVIGQGVTIGADCQIYQNSTIGGKASKAQPGEKIIYPKIGNNVTIFPNCVVIGEITIGNNVILGACSLVNKSVPDDVIAFGQPAKAVNTRTDNRGPATAMT